MPPQAPDFSAALQQLDAIRGTKTPSNTPTQTASPAVDFADALGNLDAIRSGRVAAPADTFTIDPPAQRVKLDKKEDRGKAFSGGVVSDLFDVLSLGQYALAGVATGKGVIKGIQERTSFEEVLEQSGMEPGLKRTLLGLAADVVIDPLWLVSPAKAARVLSKLPGIAGAVEKVGKSRAFQKAGRTLIYGFGVPDEIKALNADRLAEIAHYRKAAINEARFINKMDKKYTGFAEALSTYIEAPAEAKRAFADGLAIGGHKMGPLLSETAERVQKLHDEIGTLLAKNGVIEEGAFKALSGFYLKRAYFRYENPEVIIQRLQQLGTPEAQKALQQLQTDLAKGERSIFAQAKVFGVPIGAQKSRVVHSDEVRKALGEITHSGYRVGIGVTSGATAAANAKFLNEIAARYGKDLFEAGTKKIPNDAKYGNLKDKFVPENIHELVTLSFRDPSKFEQKFGDFLRFWKAGKTVLSPSGQARNLYGNFMLMGMAGIPFSRIPDLLARAGAAMWKVRHGAEPGADAAMHLAKYVDDSATTFRHAEFGDMLTRFTRGGNSLTSKIRAATIGATGPLEKATQAGGAVFELFEKLSKTAAGLWAMERGAPTRLLKNAPRGLDPRSAALWAEQALFNYAQVPRFIESVRSTGIVPFAAFSYFAANATARALWSRPAALGKVAKGMRAVEADNPEAASQRRASPQWMKSFGQVFTPLKDAKGNGLVFDASYILPFNQVGEAISSPAGLVKQNVPFGTLVYDLSNNKSSFTGRPIVAPFELKGSPSEMKSYAVKKYIDYVYKFAFPTWAPPLFPWQSPTQRVTSGGPFFANQEKAIRQWADPNGDFPSWKAAALGEILGLKTRAVNVPAGMRARVRDYQQDVQQVRTQMKKVAQDPELSWDEKQQLIGKLGQDIQDLSRSFMMEGQ